MHHSSIAASGIDRVPASQCFQVRRPATAISAHCGWVRPARVRRPAISAGMSKGAEAPCTRLGWLVMSGRQHRFFRRSGQRLQLDQRDRPALQRHDVPVNIFNHEGIARGY